MQPSEPSEESRAAGGEGADSRTSFLGRYRVVDELGKGGMASVHLARVDGPGGFQKWVAIKRIHRHLIEDESFIQLFLDEARVAASISHPNVATVFELGQADGAYFIAMEYLHGESIRDLMRWTDERHVAMPPEIACRILADAAEGLHAAHELLGPNGEKLNLVHRDVTPHNIFVTYEGNTKVVDFGIAKFSARMAKTRAGTPKGKLAYMSPEQVSGEPVDRRTDVFALGVILWELSTGQRLFGRESDLETLAKVQECEIPRPSAVASGYPLDLEKIVMKALARNKADRFKTARELSRTLQSLLMKRGLFIASEEVAAFVRSLVLDRIKTREEHLREAAKVTQTMALESPSSSKGGATSAPLAPVAFAHVAPAPARLRESTPPTEPGRRQTIPVASGMPTPLPPVPASGSPGSVSGPSSLRKTAMGLSPAISKTPTLRPPAEMNRGAFAHEHHSGTLPLRSPALRAGFEGVLEAPPTARAPTRSYPSATGGGDPPAPVMTLPMEAHGSSGNTDVYPAHSFALPATSLPGYGPVVGGPPPYVQPSVVLAPPKRGISAVVWVTLIVIGAFVSLTALVVSIRAISGSRRDPSQSSSPSSAQPSPVLLSAASSPTVAAPTPTTRGAALVALPPIETALTPNAQSQVPTTGQGAPAQGESPKPVAPVPVRPRVANGQLTVICVPSCDAVFDGETSLGAPPYYKRSLLAGTHQIKLSSSALSATKTVPVTLAPDKVFVLRASMAP